MARVLKSSMVQLDPEKPIILDLPATARWSERIAVDSSQSSGEQHIEATEEMIGECMSRARAGAATLLEQARLDAERLRTQAFEQGYRDGIARAEADRAEMIRQIAEQAEADRAAAREQLEHEIDALEPEVLELALVVAEKILQIEVSKNEKAFSSLVRHVLSLLKNCEHGTIRIAGDDCFRSIQSDSDLLSEVEGRFEMRMDEKLPAGGLVVESDSGLIDASIGTQLGRIAAAFREVSV